MTTAKVGTGGQQNGQQSHNAKTIQRKDGRSNPGTKADAHNLSQCDESDLVECHMPALKQRTKQNGLNSQNDEAGGGDDQRDADLRWSEVFNLALHIACVQCKRKGDLRTRPLQFAQQYGPGGTSLMHGDYNSIHRRPLFGSAFRQFGEQMSGKLSRTPDMDQKKML